MTFFEPSPVFLTLFFVKSFVYLPVIAILSAIRTFVASDASRLAATVSLIAALIGIATILAPTVSLESGPLRAVLAGFLNLGGGLTALLIISAPLALSAFLTGARWRWIDALHALTLLATLGLWAATLI